MKRQVFIFSPMAVRKIGLASLEALHATAMEVVNERKNPRARKPTSLPVRLFRNGKALLRWLHVRHLGKKPLKS